MREQVRVLVQRKVWDQRKLMHEMREHSKQQSIRTMSETRVHRIKQDKTHLEYFKIDEVHFDHERHERICDL